MRPIRQAQFSDELLGILEETFEGPPQHGSSAFLSRGTGLFQTLNEISAERVSVQTRPGGSTVAAHTEHLRFYLAVHYQFMQGSTEKIDWEQSWRIRNVTAAEWDRLREELHRDYRTVIEHLRALASWRKEEINLSLAIIAHTAYHLGAIRQLLLVSGEHS